MKISYTKYGIILLLVFIISIGSSLAYYSWGSTANTNFAIDVIADTIKIYYDAGSNITGSLYPTDDKEDGIKKEITVRVDKYSAYASYNIYLDLKTLPEELKDESFRYAFYNEDTVIKEGSITDTTSTCTTNSTNHIVLISNEISTTEEVKYTLYLWIDGANYTNPDDMMNQEFEFVLHADGVNVVGEDDSGGSSGEIVTLSLGDYVSYIPTSTSYTTSTAYTGYRGTQTINPSELNLWRVLNINDDGTAELISEYVSSTNVYFQGQTGYLNLVGYLNVLASQYETEGITEGSRYFGYNGQTEYITDTSKFTTTAPWTSSTGTVTVESLGGGDSLYFTDYSQVYTVLGTRIAYKVGTSTAAEYWVASRYYEYSSPIEYSWKVGYVNVSGSGGYYVHYVYNGSNFNSKGGICALRPIVTIKSDLEYTGSGTADAPYILK